MVKNIITDPMEVKVWAHMYAASDFGIFPYLVSMYLPNVGTCLARDILVSLCRLGFGNGEEKTIGTAGDSDWCATARREGVILRRGDQRLTDTADLKFYAKLMWFSCRLSWCFVEKLRTDYSEREQAAVLAKAKELAQKGWLEIDETIGPARVLAVMDGLSVELVESE